MRVTHNSIASSVLANLQGSISRLGETQQRLSSGKLINRASDSPAATVSVMELRSEIAANKQYARNADDGLGWLSLADSALQSASDQVTRARSLVLQGMSGGSQGAESRAALAHEIRQISESLRATANSKYLDRPIFGGTTYETEAFAATGEFVGNREQVDRTIGPSTTLTVNTDAGAFEIASELDPNTGNPVTIFQVLADVADKLENDPAGLSAELPRLDAVAVGVRNGLSIVGSRTNQLERMRQAADDAVMNVSKSLSDVEDIDLPQTITELQLQQTAYQAALAAGARVMQPSLIDFLR